MIDTDDQDLQLERAEQCRSWRLLLSSIGDNLISRMPGHSAGQGASQLVESFNHLCSCALDNSVFRCRQHDEEICGQQFASTSWMRTSTAT